MIATIAEYQSLFQAVVDDPSPARKLILADWLDEHGKSKEEVVLAYALEWTAERWKHPCVSPNGKSARWFREGLRRKVRATQTSFLPAELFDAFPSGEKARGAVAYKSVHQAFVALAEALQRLRLVVFVSRRGGNTP
jgi:hypothetical protein